MITIGGKKLLEIIVIYFLFEFANAKYVKEFLGACDVLS